MCVDKKFVTIGIHGNSVNLIWTKRALSERDGGGNVDCIYRANGNNSDRVKRHFSRTATARSARHFHRRSLFVGLNVKRDRLASLPARPSGARRSLHSPATVWPGHRRSTASFRPIFLAPTG